MEKELVNKYWDNEMAGYLGDPPTVHAVPAWSDPVRLALTYGHVQIVSLNFEHLHSSDNDWGILPVPEDIPKSPTESLEYWMLQNTIAIVQVLARVGDSIQALIKNTLLAINRVEAGELFGAILSLARESFFWR